MSSTETLETTQQSEPATQGHGAQEHAHEHRHGPTLNPELTREVEIEIPSDDVSHSYRAVVKRFQKQARIPGFRAGKVPESLIRSRFAEGIRQEVVESILPPHFRTAIEQKALKPVSQPQVTDLQLEDGKPLKFKAVFEVLPEFSIEGYQNVRVSKPDTALTDAEFNAELERMRDGHSTMEPVTEDRVLMRGDWAQISFKGEVKAEAPEGPKQPAANPIEGQDVLVEIGGSNTLPAFNDALTGSKPGQELKFEVSYPEEFGERRLAGKTVAYDVEVKGIKKKVEPELNDDFARQLGDYESIEDLKNKLRGHLARDKQRRLQAETREKLVDALVAQFQFPVPESLVQNQIDTRLDRGLRTLAAQGMRTEDMRKLDFARLREGQHPAAEAEVKASLILDRIADAENVTVADEDVERELEIISLQTREPLETLRSRLTNEGDLSRIREQLRREKTGNLLYERLA
ncbi:MAG: trigger factor [Silvibacterium sp.]|nr:trigger factor [Silvibacterium sp.]